jgi:hypothetical protein
MIEKTPQMKPMMKAPAPTATVNSVMIVPFLIQRQRYFLSPHLDFAPPLVHGFYNLDEFLLETLFPTFAGFQPKQAFCRFSLIPFNINWNNTK